MCFRWCRRGYYGQILIHSGNPTTFEIKVPDDTVLAEKLTFNTLYETKTKIKLWYPGQLYKELTYDETIEVFNKYIKKPWLWIGGYIGEELKDITSQVDAYVVSGNVVTIDILNRINPEIKVWIYSCSKTLEVINFPSEGIIIDDSNITKNKKVS